LNDGISGHVFKVKITCKPQMPMVKERKYLYSLPAAAQQGQQKTFGEDGKGLDSKVPFLLKLKKRIGSWGGRKGTINSGICEGSVDMSEGQGDTSSKLLHIHVDSIRGKEEARLSRWGGRGHEQRGKKEKRKTDSRFWGHRNLKGEGKKKLHPKKRTNSQS